VPRLNAARDLAPQALMREITTVIEEQTNRVYRLIRHVGDTFIATQQHNAIVQPVVRHVEAIMARDPADPTRLTPAAEDFAARCMLALVRELGLRLAQRDLIMDDLWDVFSSGPGAAIVGKLMFEPFC
jgi:hypothetical protein